VTTPQKPHQLTLEIGVHIHVGLIQNHSLEFPASREEPHRLQPHLETVAHQVHFANKLFVSDKQSKLGLVPPASSDQILYFESVPRCQFKRLKSTWTMRVYQMSQGAKGVFVRECFA
jgi:hypothetical protein